MRITAWVDRLVAATGGRNFVSNRPGMGWLAVEVIPAFIWTQITGAISMEFFYFVAFLTALGATEAQIVWLPAAVFSAGVGQALFILRRKPHDAKHRCVIDTGLGRVYWLGTILWPLTCWWLGGPVWLSVSGALFFVFIAQLTHMCGIANFITWTQAIVPRPLRGPFFAWRNIVSYGVVALTLAVVQFVLPNAEQAQSEHVIPLAILLIVATVMGIIGIIPLQLSPDQPAEARSTAYAPLRGSMWKHVPYRRFILWSLGISVAMALAPAMQPRLYMNSGVGAATMAQWQASFFYPAMIAGIIWTARILPRVHARPTLCIAHVLWIGSEICLLMLTHENAWWLGPICQLTLGTAKGMWSVAWISRLQEVIPPGDPRWSAVTLGLGAAAGLLGCIGVGPLTPWIGSQLVGTTLTVPWLFVAAGVGFRALVTPLLLLRDPPEHQLQ